MAFASTHALPGRPAVVRPPSMMKIAEVFGPPSGPLWKMVKQCGVNHVVGGFGGRWDKDRKPDEKPWSYGPLSRLKQAYEAEGFELAVIEARPPLTKAKLGLEGRDQEIDQVCELLENMGRLNIPVWCYEWMPVINWTRTSTAVPTRGGALVTEFDLEEAKRLPLTEYGVVTEDQLWASLKYFLNRVVPVAEKANVKLAMHPDDPPISPLRGMGRIMRSVENFQRLLDLVPSPVNGITLCQGNFTLMTDDLPAVIRHFGRQKKIFFVHFRDVRGTKEKFQETFHDDGKTDMAGCMRAYRDIGFDGVCRPDHVPTMEGDSNERPGYSSIGRLFAIGYIRGLMHAVYSEATKSSEKRTVTPVIRAIRAIRSIRGRSFPRIGRITRITRMIEARQELVYSVFMFLKFLPLLLLASLAVSSAHAETISLFNGKDLTGWTVDVPELDKNPDAGPSFVVRDGLLVSLGNPRGHLITQDSFSNYRLEVEYRFPKEAGNCGVLVHASKPRALSNMFPQSIEVQMHSGNAGDFWCIRENIEVPDMETRRPRKEGQAFGGDRGDARRILNLTDDSEKPVGDWNRMVIECVDREIKVWVNDDLVNHGFNATASEGKIALQAEGTEVEFRKLALTKLK